MKMIPFDLEKALAGHPLVTRDGNRAENFRKDESVANYRCNHPFYGIWLIHCHDGTCPGHPECDLFFAVPDEPKKRLSKNREVAAVKRIMRKSGWIMLPALRCELALMGMQLAEQTVSARVRDLRKEQYGGHDVHRRYAGCGMFEYKLFPRKGAK